MIVNLTPGFIASQLAVPEGKVRAESCDTQVRGLLVEVRASADAIPTYYLRFKRAGKTAYDRLGTIKDLTLTQVSKSANKR